jgi:hypothetical protein
MEFVRFLRIGLPESMTEKSKQTMIHNRLNGTRLLMGIAKLILIPCWFLWLAMFAVEWLQLLKYEQIAFEI